MAKSERKHGVVSVVGENGSIVLTGLLKIGGEGIEDVFLPYEVTADWKLDKDSILANFATGATIAAAQSGRASLRAKKTLPAKFVGTLQDFYKLAVPDADTVAQRAEQAKAMAVYEKLQAMDPAKRAKLEKLLAE